MKMDNTSRLIAAGIGLVALVLWLILPVLSFSFIVPPFLTVPLFMMNGYMLSFQINQLMMLVLLFPLAMILIPLTGDKKLTITAGVLNLIACLTVFLLKKQIITGGNLRWLFSAASALINKIGEFVNAPVTEANIDTYISVACDNFLMGGLGLWLTMAASVIYIVAVVIFGQLSVPSSTPTNPSGTQNQGTGRTTGSTKGYSHRT